TPGRLRLSRSTTSCPSLRKLSARLQPMKPAPPVITTGLLFPVAPCTALMRPDPVLQAVCASVRRCPRRPSGAPIRQIRQPYLPVDDAARSPEAHAPWKYLQSSAGCRRNASYEE